MVVKRRESSVLDRLRRSTPLVWLVIFVIASPWLRINWEGRFFYPGHLILTLVLLVALFRGGWASRNGRLALLPALFLGIYLVFITGLRENWENMLIIGGVTLVNLVWGWGAYRFGKKGGGTGSVPDALVLLIGASLLMGLVGWAGAALWRPLCYLINCPPQPERPYDFLGGWVSHEQFWLHLLLSLPVAGSLLIIHHRSRGSGKERFWLNLILVGSLLGLLAGAKWWNLALLGLLLLGVMRVIGPLARRGDLKLFRNAGVAIVGGLVLVYGFFPGYLGLASGELIGGGEISLELIDPPPEFLSSEREQILNLKITNSGLTTLFGDPERPVWLGLRILVTPERGNIRTFDGQRALMEETLTPGQSREVSLAVRLPHWVSEGFLSWRVEPAESWGLKISENSQLGFRFHNEAYRTNAGLDENLLTPLADRARDYLNTTFQSEPSKREKPGIANILGGMLDSLFFSPIWGLAPSRDNRGLAPSRDNRGLAPFAGPFPFWPRMLNEFGLAGVLPGIWFLLRMRRKALRIAGKEIRFGDRITWRLLPLSIGMVMISGIFSTELGSYHAIWGLIILSGFIEGRYDHMFARVAGIKPRRPARRWFRRKKISYAPPRRKKRRTRKMGGSRKF